MGQDIATMKGLTVWQGARIATMDPKRIENYGLLEDHDLLTEGETIVGLFPHGSYSIPPEAIIYDLEGLLITPGFIECHTHIVFGGNRAKEWEMRQNGISYADISAQGEGLIQPSKRRERQVLRSFMSALICVYKLLQLRV